MSLEDPKATGIQVKFRVMGTPFEYDYPSARHGSVVVIRNSSIRDTHHGPDYSLHGRSRGYEHRRHVYRSSRVHMSSYKRHFVVSTPAVDPGYTTLDL